MDELICRLALEEYFYCTQLKHETKKRRKTKILEQRNSSLGKQVWIAGILSNIIATLYQSCRSP